MKMKRRKRVKKRKEWKNEWKKEKGESITNKVW